LVGPCLVSYLIFKSTIPVADGGYHLPWWNILLSYMVWLSATRTAKLLPHLWYRPQDIIYVPAFILFGYYFAIMKLYALCTLHETGWGTRAGIGDASAATAALAAQDRENEKNANGGPSNGPYQRPSYLYNNSDSQIAPPLDTSVYRDNPNTPVYSSRSTTNGIGNVNMRRSRGENEALEMQSGLAR